MSARILICGDIAPPPATVDALCHAPLERLAPGHAELFRSADLVLANLEAPLSPPGSGSRKSGPVLQLPAEVTAGLRELRIQALGLANNHSMDHGPAGLERTRAALDQAGIRHCGAGATLAEASRPLLLEAGGRRVGLLAVGAQEFGVARPDRPGMCPLDPVHALPALQGLVRQCEFPIVLVHAGNEGHAYPNPWLQAYCRLLVDTGARVVVCQHSHRTGCLESHGEGTILYGQGNFLMDLPIPTPDYYREGLLLEINLPESGPGHEVRVHAFRQRPEQGDLARLEPAREAQFLAEFRQRSAELADPQRVHEHWLAFCSARARTYKAQLSVANRVLLKALVGLGLADLLLPESRRLLLQNLIRCQDHREALLTILEERL
ncbi:MAG: CapA family protein [Candidatus Delongbacteria bacterium]